MSLSLMGLSVQAFKQLVLCGDNGYAQNVFGNEFIVGTNFDYVNFTHPVRANDLLTTEVEIVGLRASSNPNRGEVTKKFTVKNQNGEVVALVQSKSLIKTKASISTQKSAIS